MDPAPQEKSSQFSLRKPTAHMSKSGYAKLGAPPPLRAGRNDKCPCKSGKKYKKCCMNPDLGWGKDDEGRYITAQELTRQFEARNAADRVRQTLGDYNKGVAIK